MWEGLLELELEIHQAETDWAATEQVKRMNRFGFQVRKGFFLVVVLIFIWVWVFWCGLYFIFFLSLLVWFGFFWRALRTQSGNWRPTLQLSIYWTPIYTLQQMQVECFGINLPGSYTEWGGNFFNIWMSVWIPHSQWWESLQLMIDKRSAFLLYYVALETTSRRHFQISKRCWPWQISAKGVIRNDPSAWW